jgi:hypothetical protein
MAKKQLNGLSADIIFVDELYLNTDVRNSKIPLISGKNKWIVNDAKKFEYIPQKYKISDLIRAEITRLKILNYKDSKTRIYLGGPDWLDFFREELEELNPFSSEEITWYGVTVVNNKTNIRMIKGEYFNLVNFKQEWLAELF